MTNPENHLERVRPLWLIVGLLGLWGAYLAVGATNAFTPNAAEFDLRKFFIVAACSVGYLAFWWGNLRLAKHRRTANSIASPVSVSSVFAFVLSVVAYVLWAWAHQVNDHLAIRIGLVSAVLFGCSMIAAMIGISDRAAKSAKWAGSAAFLMFVAAIILFIIQVQVYISR